MNSISNTLKVFSELSIKKHYHYGGHETKEYQWWREKSGT